MPKYNNLVPNKITICSTFAGIEDQKNLEAITIVCSVKNILNSKYYITKLNYTIS